MLKRINKKFLLIFLAIVVLAAILRFYKLADIPPGVNRDEASIGYTAYSLLKTGKDEYGRVFPLSFQSFGDWKLPLYIYTVVPLVSLLGLSELPVRLPSAIFGLTTVIFTFFLVKNLFKNNLLAFLTMFLVAVSPWHLHLSRVESESNMAVLLITIAVILFFKSLNNRHWLIIPSFIFFALTYFTYAGNYIFTTLFIFGLILIYKSKIPRTKYLYIGACLFVLLSGFILAKTVFANKTKISGTGIFSDPYVVQGEIANPRGEHANPSSLTAKFFHNRLIYSVQKFTQNYLNAFSPQFLFIQGGENKAHNISNFGNMYLIEAPFLFFGLLSLIFLRKGKEKKLALWWFLIAPVAASITKDAPHTNRMFAIFPILSLVVAMGITWTLINFQKHFRKLIIIAIALLFVVNIGLYLDRYYVHFPKEEVKNWGFGYKKLYEILNQEKYISRDVVMSEPESSPYIFLLFYSKYDPQKYQNTAVRYEPTADGFVHVGKFDRYEFKGIDWGEDFGRKNTIIVDFSSGVPHSMRQFVATKITLFDDQAIFSILER